MSQLSNKWGAADRAISGFSNELFLCRLNKIMKRGLRLGLWLGLWLGLSTLMRKRIWNPRKSKPYPLQSAHELLNKNYILDYKQQSRSLQSKKWIKICMVQKWRATDKSNETGMKWKRKGIQGMQCALTLLMTGQGWNMIAYIDGMWCIIAWKKCRLHQLILVSSGGLARAGNECTRLEGVSRTSL